MLRDLCHRWHLPVKVKWDKAGESIPCEKERVGVWEGDVALPGFQD